MDLKRPILGRPRGKFGETRGVNTRAAKTHTTAPLEGRHNGVTPQVNERTVSGCWEWVFRE